MPEIFVKAVCVGYSSNGQRRGGEGGNKTGNDRGGVVVNRKKEREREANVVKNTSPKPRLLPFLQSRPCVTAGRRGLDFL